MNKKTILVIDEEKSIREAFSDILTDEGYKVLAAASGEEALKLLGSESIDIVLMEISISDMDGFTLYEEIKKIREGLPVIIVAGHANCDTAFQAGKMDFHGFLEKPVSLDRLLVMLHRAFDKK